MNCCPRVQRFQPKTNSADGLLIQPKMFYKAFLYKLRDTYQGIYSYQLYYTKRNGNIPIRVEVMSNFFTTNSAVPCRLSPFSGGISGRHLAASTHAVRLRCWQDLVLPYMREYRQIWRFF